jgi:CheY-like chemotaxis protein
MTEYNEEPGYILVVDDTPSSLRLLVAALRVHEYKVRPVLNGKEALEMARREPPSLVLLDINMPEMDGYETCTEFKKHPTWQASPLSSSAPTIKSGKKYGPLKSAARIISPNLFI